VREPQVLILDEATSALDYPTRERLFAMLREAARRGVGVIFISHRMDEIDELGDRITVMRSGRTVATLDRGCFDRETIVRLMTGEEPLTPARARTMHRHRSSVALTARRVVLAPGAAPIDLDIRSGEMLGVAGLEGHGQERFLRALAGHPPLAGETYRVRGERPERIGSPADAARLGIAYVPRERRSEGLFQSKSVRENFGMPTLARDAPRGIIHKDRTRKRLTSYQTLLRIKIDDAEASIARLSGGNQQKTLIARWLACQPRVLLLNDPTRGVDIAAKRDLYELLAELTAEGVAVVMLSSELDEHVELMDRVVVFHENAISAELQAGGVTRQSLVAAFFAMRERDA
jgi:ABC-type sugar transport system ATPase subunit